MITDVKGEIQLQMSGDEVLRKIFGHADCEVSGSLEYLMSGI